MKRKTFAFGLILSLFMNAAPAHADIYNGVCALRLDFSFSEPVRSVTYLNPQRSIMTYDLDISGAVDLDTSQTGMQACADTVSLPRKVFKRTFGSGWGQEIVWTCEAATGFGSWNQYWEPDTAPVFGTHTIAGTWGNWVINVVNESLQFTGTIDATVAASDATKLATQCRTTGITSLTMVGVMHFSDPTLPPAH